MSLKPQPSTRDRNMSTGSKSITSHPRRKPAHESVSLVQSHINPLANKRTSLGLHSPAGIKRRTSSTSNQANPPSSRSPPPLKYKQSSGESSNASKWFETSNNDVAQGHKSYVDNDPPFFLRNSSSSESPPERQIESSPHQRPTSAPGPYQSQLARFPTYQSSSEDFRSVIDDLTVANKKLKKKLRKYEKLHDAHLQDEKSFEVRVHGLPADKKRELEDLLRNFATGLGQSPEGPSLTAGPDLTVPTANLKKSTSLSSTRFADSAYASASASVQASAMLSTNETDERKASRTSRAQNNANVRSYLHDIPTGLLPRQPVAMTEKAKKKLVVRRLEQIFAGELSSTIGHQHEMQQQEVAQSAAKHDFQAMEVTGESAGKEGYREARIMSRDQEQNHVDSDEKETYRTVLAGGESKESTGVSYSPHQRPTRPLDLDPNRAQVPAENIRYLRHLGFSPKDADAVGPQDDKHGWVYLNVVINMAQLHTINVTADFVKAAIAEYSNKLELSHDERRLRWRGGMSVTRNSSDTSPDERASEDSKANGAVSTRNGRKRIKLAAEGSNSSSGVSKFMSRKARDKFAYTPLFYRKDSESDAYESSPEQISAGTSPWATQPAGDSSAFTSSGMMTSSSRKRKDDGPIIFYNGARFCTDLSGDRNNQQQASNEKSYSSITSRPLGTSAETPPALLRADSCRGPLAEAEESGEPMDVDTDNASTEPDLQFSPRVHMSRPPSQEDKNARFEVSGLGGVHPEDNFVVDVQCRQAHTSEDQAGDSLELKVWPSKLRHVLDNGIGQSLAGTKRRRPSVQQEVISTQHRRLPASALPPPASFFQPYDSDGESDDGASSTSEVSSHISLTSSTGREVAPQPLNFLSESSGSEPDTSSDEDDDAGSLDLLASAREADPENIIAREREYDTNMAERLRGDPGEE